MVNRLTVYLKKVALAQYVHGHTSIQPQAAQNPGTKLAEELPLPPIGFPLLKPIQPHNQYRASQVPFFPLTSKVTVEYIGNMGAMGPLKVHAVVISLQHGADISLEEIRRSLMEKVVREVVPARCRMISVGATTRDEDQLLQIVQNNLDLRPGIIVKYMPVPITCEHL
ncbi:unnamed protein product [Lota lota]